MALHIRIKETQTISARARGTLNVARARGTLNVARARGTLNAGAVLAVLAPLAVEGQAAIPRVQRAVACWRPKSLE